MMELGCGSAGSYDKNYGMGQGFELLAWGKNSGSGCLVDNNLRVGTDEGIADGVLAVAIVFEMASVQIRALAENDVPDAKGRPSFCVGLRHNIGYVQYFVAHKAELDTW